MKINKIIILLILLIIPLYSSFASTSMLDQILDKFEKWDDSYEEALRKKPNRQSKIINDLTDEMLKIVGQSEALNLKDEIINLREKKSKLQADLDSKQEQLLFAPHDKRVWEVWVKTSESLDEEISEISQQIDDTDYQIIVKKSEIQDLFIASGVTLSISDIDVLTGGSYGDDILNLLIVGQNINAILTQYRDNIIAAQGTYRAIALSLRYYKLYRLSVVTQIRAIDLALQNLSEHQEKISKLIKDNAKLMAETEKKITSDTSNQENYLANFEGQKINESVMYDFMSLLNKYKIDWNKKREELVQLRDMVQNTIETATISSEVSSMMGETLTMINSLNSVQIGEVLPFENSGLERQFEELSLAISK